LQGDIELCIHKTDLRDARHTYGHIEKEESLAWITTFKEMFDKCCFTSWVL